MKRCWVVLLCLSLGALAGAQTPIMISVDGSAMVPLRLIGEWFGATIDYGEGMRVVVMTLGKRSATLTMESTEATFNGESYQMPAAPLVRNGVTYVPLRFLSDAFGAPVSWTGARGQAIVRHPITDEDLVLGFVSESIAVPTINQAAAQGNLDAVRALVKSRKEAINTRDKSGLLPIHNAAAMGYSRIVAFLLENGAQVEARTTTGNFTPLHLAARYGHAKAADELLQHGAEVDVHGGDGSTPLQWAAGQGRSAVISLLVEKGGDVEDHGVGQPTPLQLATREGYDRVVTLLLAAKADVDAVGPGHMTALHFAADNNRLAIAQLLLDAKADVNARTDGGLTPLALAKKKGYDDMVALLRDSGGEEK